LADARGYDAFSQADQAGSYSGRPVIAILGSCRLVEKLLQTPRPERPTRRNRWRRFQGHVHAAEVVIGEEQGERSFVVLPFFGVSVGESRHSANRHADRTIVAFDVRRANALGVRVAELRGYYRIHYLRRRISPFIRRLTVHFYQRGVIDAAGERRGDRCLVGSESVRGQLEPAGRSLLELVGKGERIRGGTLAKVPSDDHLGIALNRGEAIGIAELFALVLPLPRFFLAPDESPDFINLDIGYWNPLYYRLHERFALLACLDHRADDRVAVNAGQPFNRANRVAFQEHAQAEDDCRWREPTPIHRARGLVGECAAARIAPIALGTVPVLTEATGLAVTEGAFHIEPPFFVSAAR
jgi:hypothetical protein